jgi:hypothetical protein
VYIKSIFVEDEDYKVALFHTDERKKLLVRSDEQVSNIKSNFVEDEDYKILLLRREKQDHGSTIEICI